MSVAALGVFAACGNKSDSSESEGKDYSYYYTNDPETLDYTFSGQRYTAENTANFVDGLVSYDQYRQIVPALAKSWDVSEDGKTYTYHIRKDVPWSDVYQNKQGDSETDLTGLLVWNTQQILTLKHFYLLTDSITGLADYASGKNTRTFQKLDQSWLIKLAHWLSTLNAPESFWNSKATYGILYPINAEFLKEKGKDFGKVATDGILYNGAFIATKFDNKSAIEYKANNTLLGQEKRTHQGMLNYHSSMVKN